jgi:hypothetical protein
MGPKPNARYRIRHDGSYQFNPFRIQVRRWFIWIDIGSEATLAKAEKYLKDRIENERLMAQLMKDNLTHYDDNGNRIEGP